MQEIIQQSITFFLFIVIVFIVLLWFLIKSAVKHGTKEAIMESYKQILEIENDPVKKDLYSKPLKQIHQEEFQEEYNNW